MRWFRREKQLAAGPRPTNAAELLKHAVPLMSQRHFHHENEVWSFLAIGRSKPIGVMFGADGGLITLMATSDLYLDPHLSSRAILWDLLVANDSLALGSYRLVQNDNGFCVTLGMTTEAIHHTPGSFCQLIESLIRQFETLLFRLYAKDLVDETPWPSAD